MAIRNAPGPYADGVFSTSGPCGGANKWSVVISYLFIGIYTSATNSTIPKYTHIYTVALVRVFQCFDTLCLHRGQNGYTNMTGEFLMFEHEFTAFPCFHSRRLHLAVF